MIELTPGAYRYEGFRLPVSPFCPSQRLVPRQSALPRSCRLGIATNPIHCQTSDCRVPTRARLAMLIWLRCGSLGGPHSSPYPDEKTLCEENGLQHVYRVPDHLHIGLIESRNRLPHR